MKKGLFFDEQVARLRAAGIFPVSTAKKKSQCTPEEWAANLEWRSGYYKTHKKEWEQYRNRWLVKKSKNEVFA